MPEIFQKYLPEYARNMPEYARNICKNMPGYAKNVPRKYARNICQENVKVFKNCTLPAISHMVDAEICILTFPMCSTQNGNLK